METNNEYKLMSYFVVGTLHFYRNDIIESETVGEFRTNNPKLIQTIFEDGKKYFNYELSFNQISKGILAYMAKPNKLNKEMK